ncbi:sugar ABC transporter permease [Bailinhaonella thermotolerans]|uniref:Sugar ABC transporter permease n=2 Tax=Bailinhaonella thermotolerans TaxID=1070861 RepID=A0A3A4A2I6_9ACTN|nr:sugar ABC transporter permease [Bailinhaonella thermotolerans]
MVVLPVLWTLMLAFQDVRLINIRQVGLFGNYTLENLSRVLSSPNFAEALRTTLIFTVAGTTLSILLGLAAALCVRRPFRGRTFVRAAMLLPYVAPVVAVTFVWEVMLHPQFGVVNEIGTSLLGWERAIPFLSQEGVALATVIAFEAWRYFPFAFLFLLARLQAIPGDLDEAARVDGATPLQRFRHITFPQLTSVIALLAVLRFIWTFNEFDDIYLLTGGGAGTEVVSVRVFQLLTARADVGEAAAQAMVLAVALVVLLGIYFAFFARRFEETPS